MGQLIDRENFERGIRRSQFLVKTGQVLSPAALELARERGIEIVREGTGRQLMPRQAQEIESLSERILKRFVEAGMTPGPELIDAVAAEVAAIARGDKPAEVPGTHQDSQMAGCLTCGAQRVESGRERVVVTSAGRNTFGIVAGLASAIAEAQADILDLSQTLVGDYFTMIIVVDIAHASQPFEGFRERLAAVGARLGVHVAVMHDELLRSMHRV
ncbi:MAG: ACT domain-containing protein [Pseudomonadota bacterium]